MNDTNNNYCLILAGGVGSRLWPMSRKSKPKQFLDIFGTGKTLLQQTYERFARFFDPSHIYISTHVDYLPLVYEQLPQVDDAHILEEPIARGTLAAVAWGTVVMAKENPQASLIVTPADQLILQEEDFRQDVLQGLSFVQEHDNLLVMGIRPTRAETSYGYIQMGEHVCNEQFSHVQSFTEKPERQFAEMFLQDGGFLWNVGISMFRVDVMLRNIDKFVPEYQQIIPKMQADAELGDPMLQPEFFKVLPMMSIDLSILERSDNVCVQECHFGWADLGAWEMLKPEPLEDNQLVNSRALLHNCKGNVIALPEGRIAVIDGLTDYVVAEQGDVLLICPKNRATVRRLMQEAQMQLGVE